MTDEAPFPMFMPKPSLARWDMGTSLRKKKGSSWHGCVVGFYSTPLTPIGYAIESAFEPGSVQIYPESALEEWLIGVIEGTGDAG